MTQQQLEKYLWGAATALRGTIDAGDYKQYIFPLLFFKRICDVYDEEYANALAESDGDIEYAAFAENHHFQIPAGAHWNDVRETTTNVGMAIRGSHAQDRKSQSGYPVRHLWRRWTKNRLSDET
ncbi:MAG: type I restriction-modification system subunit M N-terminal domain-containing protein [Saprospiraceae bacterium]